MIRYLNANNFDDIENYLLRHPDKEYQTTRYTYYFKQVGDCAGIFRVGRVNRKKDGTRPAVVKDKEELVAYYHEGEI